MEIMSKLKSFFGGKLRSEEPPSEEEPEVPATEDTRMSKVVQTSRNIDGAYQPQFNRRRR